MAMSPQEIRELCTAREWALVQASQPGSIEKLSSTELKKHAVNAQKLVTKWQDLSRSQNRTESRKSGSPNVDSRSHEKHDLFKTALSAFQAQLATGAAAPASSGTKGKPNSRVRSSEARSARRTTRKTLNREKKSLNRAAAPAAKPVAAPVAPAAKPTTKKATKKKPAPKTAAAKASTKLAAQRRKRAAAIAAAAPAVPQPKAPKAIKVKATPAKQVGLAGKVKATRTAIAVRTNKIAGHVSGKGKRAQGKRDSRGR
ncbi:MAG: hypothetical protein ACK553_00415 [Planctomycetota bacterium]|jgi:hypothetical protein